MPCGGGDIGLNVWVENGVLLFYISRSGTFDENNAFLKLGRVRMKFSPNPFNGTQFKQELSLKEGAVYINGANGSLRAQIKIWVDVFRPVIHVSANCNQPIKSEAAFETWRYKDHMNSGARENSANSYKWAKMPVTTYKDEVGFKDHQILFFHRNKDATIFDVTVQQQGLDSVKSRLFNPLQNLTFGGLMEGKKMMEAGTYSGKYINTDFEGYKLKSKRAYRNQDLSIYLNVAQTKTLDEWKNSLDLVVNDAKTHEKSAWKRTIEWWDQYWNRSFIFIDQSRKENNSGQWQAGRNYQLFRYMLGCNAYGSYPTKFNGGLFTYDPSLTDSTLRFTPDHRNWGGGLMTAQNQRLVYYPMLKSGDFDMMKPQFDFYLRSLQNAELRSEVYWGHKGACFTEQLENFGLPNCSEYGWNRPYGFDKGLEYNAWLEYEWDTVLEFCFMILESERYSGKDISGYLPLIESCLNFFNEHYQYLAKKRGIKAFDAGNHLVLFPGSPGETYKMAYNSTTTIAALQTVISRLLALPEKYLDEQKRTAFKTMLQHIPPISFTEFSGHKTIAPAKLWERINNTEAPQLYPVFPWGIYGVGKPDLDIAVNTWRYDTNVVRFKDYKGWKQYNIFAARLGLIQEAAQLNVLKMKDSERRFPAFWGPGFDWTPDHNWGGSGIIGLQEMLLQTDDRKIFLFPAWPKTWDVHFKLHAPYNTTVEGVVEKGKVISLKVSPENRLKDVVNMF